MPKKEDEKEAQPRRGRPSKGEVKPLILRLKREMYQGVYKRAKEKETTVTGVIETAIERELKRN